MHPKSLKNIVPILCSVAIASGTIGCARINKEQSTSDQAQLQAHTGTQAECLPSFPDHAGWYGGDAAYSVPLPMNQGRTSLWLFGDTFVERTENESEEANGRSYPFVHNSIGISHCGSNGDWRLETFWQKNQQPKKSRAFFLPDPKAAWVRHAQLTSDRAPYYWLFGGFIAHDSLFVGLLRVVDSEPRGPFNLPFRLAGMDLARIENYRDAPSDWRVQISTLSNSTTAFPGSAFALTSSHINAFAFFDRGDGRTPRMLGRIDLDHLAQWKPDLSVYLEYWAEDATWKPGFAPDDAMILMGDDASEMSVHFDEATKNWLAVYLDPRQGQQDGTASYLQLRNAKSLTGPWSQPQNLLAIPETIPDSRGERAAHLFCYAGKAHPQFSSRGEITITYVCNLFAEEESQTWAILEALTENPQIYRPRATSVKIPTDDLIKYAPSD